jgi:PadR family transcriptional regulator, regulatory protein PadR
MADIDTHALDRERMRGSAELLYRLEERAWITGTWIEKPDERRRRFYEVTPEGRRVLAQQRRSWDAFVAAVRRVTEPDHA